MQFFAKKDMAHMFGALTKKKLTPKINFWAAGEAFFSDLGPFAKIEDCSPKLRIMGVKSILYVPTTYH